jgi:hypothetical protein
MQEGGILNDKLEHIRTENGKVVLKACDRGQVLF